MRSLRSLASRGSRSGAFTLLELIVVITIIGILATIVTINTTKFTKNARRTRVEADLKKILSVARMRQTESGSWPESIEEMTQKKYAVSGKDASASLDAFPKDPWDHEYRYEMVDGEPRVSCLGKDNAEGGTDEDEDVYEPPIKNN